MTTKFVNVLRALPLLQLRELDGVALQVAS